MIKIKYSSTTLFQELLLVKGNILCIIIVQAIRLFAASLVAENALTDAFLRDEIKQEQQGKETSTLLYMYVPR